MFTNKSTIELIPQNEINSDFGVLLFRSASFNKFDKSKYQNPDGTPNDLAVKKIYECLIHKHRSVFFGSRLTWSCATSLDGSKCYSVDFSKLTKDAINGIEYNGVVYSISIFLALKWIYQKRQEVIDIPFILEKVQAQYPACYKALKMLPKESVTDEENGLLEEQRTKFISFKAELPIFIARQLYRSRGINFTERSGRYTAENTRFFKPYAWRKAPEKATQGSGGNVDDVLNQKCSDLYVMGCENTFEDFNAMIDSGISKELARIELPLSQMTTTINTVDLYTLSSVLSQRLDKHAQFEIRQVAQQLYDIACEKFGKELVDKLIDIQNRLIF